MNLKILCLILLILFFIPITLCEKIEDININNTKIYNEKDKIISIYDKNIDKSMDIKLISTTSDINKLIKIIEITNFKSYKPNKKQDFITKTKKIYGKNNIYKIEYFIEKYNYTFDYIIVNEIIYNNKTGKNETKLINKTIIKDIKPFWVKFEPYNKQILKDEKFKLKIIHYKKPEIGFFKIQTIPIFKNIECKEFTWWLGNWNLKRNILINNTYGNNVINYRLKSINLSQYQINASSTRIINESSGLIQNHWNESIDSNGNLAYIWVNFTKINNNSWFNDSFAIYYQFNPNVNSSSNLTKLLNQSNFCLDNGIIATAEDYYTTHIPNNVIDNSFSTMWYNYQPSIHDTWININFTKNKRIVKVNLLGMDDGTGGTTKGYYNLSCDNIHVLQSNIKTWGIVENHNYSDIFNPIVGINFKMYWLFTQTQTTEGVILKEFEIYGFDYNNNEPELWTVGNIEYPEDLDMNCSLKIITHLTEKEIKIVNMTGDIVNISKSNECINLSYDSYILYMANPVKISSFTELLNTIDNVFIQFFLFAFLIVIGIIFFTFLQIIKNKGFKGVTK